MHKNHVFTVLLCFCTLLLVFCCKSASKADAPSEMSEMSSPVDRDAGPVSEEGGVSDGGLSSQPDVADTRKRVKKGDVSYRVKDPVQAEKALVKSLKEHGGYVDSSVFRGSSIMLTVRVPADNFDSFVSAAESVGVVLHKNIVVEDVTGRFTDLDNRIKNRRILLERYQEYLRQAKNIEELLKLEREINNLTTEIEGLEGSFNSLKHQISYSSLQIDLVPVTENIVTRNWPSLQKDLGNLGFALTNFFYGLLFIVIYLICFGLPLLLLLALGYWLAFGKLGLLRKFFKVLTPDESESSKKEK